MTALAAAYRAGAVASSVSRGVIIAAAAVYIAVQPYYAASVWGPFRLATVFAAAYGFAAARWRGGVLLAPGLAATFLIPGLFVLGTGSFFWPLHAIWLAMLLGAAASPRRLNWSLPAVLQIPLAAWALIVAGTAAVVMAREADFSAVTLRSFSVVNSGTPARLIVQWVALSAAGLLVGILWLDHLFGRYCKDDRHRFAVGVVWPLAIGWAVNAIVAVYQWQVDPNFLEGGWWAVLERASGMVRDANGLGALCAMWGPALAALALDVGGRRVGIPLAIVCIALAWAAVWASGSRGAYVILLLSTAAFAVLIVRQVSRRRFSFGVIAGATLLAAALVGYNAGRNSGPAERLGDLSRQFSESPRTALLVLWSRQGYGDAAASMIADHPITGVGFGTFHSRVGDYSPAVLGYRLPPDNAQNWYRHQLAELGALGSLGWVAWVLFAALVLFTAAPASAGRFDVWVVRWVLIAFGGISTVAMPGQDLFVALTFWTLAYWFLSGVHARTGWFTRAFAHPAAWLVVWGLAIANVALVAVEASWQMRPPVRAARRDSDYSYGFSFSGQTATTTATHAVVVPRASEKWLKLTYQAEHPDADTNRVKVDVWRDGDHIVSRRISRAVPVTEYLPVPKGQRFVLELKIDRTFGHEQSDTRQGLAVHWDFVPDTPPGVQNRPSQASPPP